MACAFFEGQERNTVRLDYGLRVNDWLKTNTRKFELLGLVEGKRNGVHPLVPFHWQIEFPEVFASERLGFDCIVGNPPFLGGKRISTVLGEEYKEWLSKLHVETTSNVDIVAHFFRRSFDLLKKNSSLGLISTNSISQGDTRKGGLKWIRKNSGTIFSALKRVRWPGKAAVIVSVVWILKGKFPNPKILDGKTVQEISAYLVDGAYDDDPLSLKENQGKAFIGSIILGMGFTFDDTDKKGLANSLEDMNRLIKKDPKNKELIFPYIGGEEINSHPEQKPHRFVINFGEMSEEKAKEWPDLYKIVLEKVKPVRLTQGSIVNPKRWWMFARPASELNAVMKNKKSVLALSRHSPNLALVFVSSKMVFSEATVVFPTDSYFDFSILQSGIHEAWARFFSSSMKDDLRYSPSDCFETFPQPDRNRGVKELEDIGRTYHDLRRNIMTENEEGLTTVYNRLNNPDEKEKNIQRLRGLQIEMDQLVLKTYGWNDLATDHDFFLDFEEEHEEKDKRKKPYRYRLSNELKDKIIGRLLDLNGKKADREKEEDNNLGLKTTRFKKTISDENQSLSLF